MTYCGARRFTRPGFPRRRTRFADRCDLVQRHKSHIPAALIRAKEAEEVAHADTLLDQIRQLQQRAITILDKAERAGDLRAAISAIGQAKGVLELLGKASGELNSEPQHPPGTEMVFNLAKMIVLPRAAPTAVDEDGNPVEIALRPGFRAVSEPDW